MDPWDTMAPAARLAAARHDAQTRPIESIDLSDAELFRHGVVHPYFERLRRDAPVHWQDSGIQGRFWSVTRYRDIMAVDTHHAAFSSDWTLGGIGIVDLPREKLLPTFIAMDPPRHDEQRRVVQPIVAPQNLQRLQGTIRERTCEVLDGLPRVEPFDWVDRVSIELTTRMLATLFDFPFEERRKLTHWSDVATYAPPPHKTDKWAWRDGEIRDCLQAFTRLWEQRVNAPPAGDLVSMLAHAPATRDMPPDEFLGNLLLLIVGGNDTTRNSMSGLVWFFSQHPDQWELLTRRPDLQGAAVSEVIRYQTPLAHMRRTAVQDVELGGQRIREGDKVVMWYASGNRDEEAIPQADRFWIERPHPRQHLSFGFGIHRCVGNRLAELQLAILLEEMLRRDLRPTVLDEPVRVKSTFVNGYKSLPVRLDG